MELYCGGYFCPFFLLGHQEILATLTSKTQFVTDFFWRLNCQFFWRNFGLCHPRISCAKFLQKKDNFVSILLEFLIQAAYIYCFAAFPNNTASDFLFSQKPKELGFCQNFFANSVKFRSSNFVFQEFS